MSAGGSDAPDWSREVVMLAGATGRVGSELSRIVLAGGGRLAAAVRRPWQVEMLRRRLGAGRILVGCVAPRDAEAAAGFVKGAEDALGPITAFVGAAGAFAAAVAGKEPAGDLDDLIEANLHANATLARAVLPRLRRRGQGALLLLAGCGAPPEPPSATCRAAAAAVQAYADALAADLAGTAIGVAALTPAAGSTAAASAIAAWLACHRRAEPGAGGLPPAPPVGTTQR